MKEQEVRLTVPQPIRYATVQRGLDGGLTNAEAARAFGLSARCLLPSQMPASRTTTPAAKRAHEVCPKGTPRLIPTRNRTAPGGPECGLPPAGGREGG